MIDSLAKEFQIKKQYVNQIITLIDEGNTIPFIARYRKEMTGSVDDQVLRNFYDRLMYLRNLDEKRETTKQLINDLEKMTPEIEKLLNQAQTMTEIDDIYRPFRPKRRTKATIAKEKGLDALAQHIWEQNNDRNFDQYVMEFINPDLNVFNAEEALQGALDICAEMISDDATMRKMIREFTINEGRLESKAKQKEQESVYEMYYEYAEGIKKIAPHRVLALNRGEKEGFLQVKIEVDVDKIHDLLKRSIIKSGSQFTTLLTTCLEDAYKRLIAPSIEREVRNELTEKAEENAIYVFSENLKQLLLQAPMKNKRVLGFDPAFRTGCKLAALDETGKLLETTVIYPTAPQFKTEEAEKIMLHMINKHQIDLIAIGNGTASRESEKFVSAFLKKYDLKLQFVIISEAGASVYSASQLAAKEFPEFDVSLRSAVSIGRRLQDPLAELVKINPKSIGVGQYQHDLNQKKLENSLGGVVEDCVNTVGVNLNTASDFLLAYVSGLNSSISSNIIAYRNENGKFKNRKELLKVKKLGPKTFTQCAGFLRIPESDNFLDRTAVHPESYSAALALLKKLNMKESDWEKRPPTLNLDKETLAALSEELQVGIYTLQDIIAELEKPGRDLRDEMEAPILHSEVLDIEDLQEGMVLNGTVRNITDFGAFVDVGVGTDGLLHISEISNSFIKHPMDVLKVSSVISVKVKSVDVAKKRISFTAKGIQQFEQEKIKAATKK